MTVNRLTRFEERLFRAGIALMVAVGLAAFVPGRAVPSGPPPANVPQACTPSYCVEVIPTYPNAPGRIAIDTRAFSGDEALTMELGEGLHVAFRAKFVDGRLRPREGEARWQRDGSRATAWACLRCGATRGRDAVLGVAVTGIPPRYDARLYGLTVCFWPLDMAAAGMGDGKSLRLGDRVCILA